MTKDSYIHVIDRFMALINLSTQTWKVSVLFYHARPATFYCQLCTVTLAIFCFMNSQEAQQDHHPEGFIFWHNLWHCYPFVAIFIECIDYYYFGEYVYKKSGESYYSYDDAGNKLWIKLKAAIMFNDYLEQGKC